MKILIKDTLTIEEIKEKFTHKFPYLKIEFFNKPHKNLPDPKRKHDPNRHHHRCE